PERNTRLETFTAALSKWRLQRLRNTGNVIGARRRSSLPNTNTPSRDVLRRHWKSCKTRLENGIEMPESHRGGKHKRACDSCASIRKACDGENPCAECTHRGRTCTYQRLEEDRDAPASNVHHGAEENNSKVDAFESAMEIDHPAGQAGPPGPVWELGLQNFYPSREAGKIVYARNKFGT
ncbi:hypothetical protein F1880_003738, partial [Penicillium rolfsii]